MEKILTSKFHIFDQNNSGGYYFQDEKNNKLVIVEYIVKEQLENFYDNWLNHSYCNCCGERWSFTLSKNTSISDMLEEIKSYKWMIEDTEKDINIFLLNEDCSDWNKISYNEFFMVY